MKGQAQEKQYNQNTLYNKYNKELMNQVKMWFITDKFAVKTEYEPYKALNSYLQKELYGTQDCEVKNFIHKKLTGALTEENLDIVELRSLQIKYRDINNYFYTNPTWEKELW